MITNHPKLQELLAQSQSMQPKSLLMSLNCPSIPLHNGKNRHNRQSLKLAP
jgi:hypothetical protein